MSQETSYSLKPRNPGEAIKVAEAVLERRDRNMQALADRAGKIKQLRKDRKQLAKPKRLLSAQKLVKQNISKRAEKKRILITAMKGKNKRMGEIPEDAKVLLVVRNDKKAYNNKIVKALSLLRLTVPHNGRFIRPTVETLENMRIALPFLYFGVPSVSTVTTLLQKKAYMRTSKDTATPLNDNAAIEAALGSSGVLCVEDIIEVISKGEAAFDQVNDILTPFHLTDFRQTHGNLKTSRPVSGYVKNIDKIAKKIV